MKTDNTTENPTEREVTLTHVFDAPRELVFQAWTDPALLSRWFGPRIMTIPICEVDARAGGKWHIVMRAQDGAEYPCGGMYEEVQGPERIVFTNNAVDAEGKVIIAGHTTVTLTEQDGKTLLTLRTRGKAMVEYAVNYLKGMEAGWSQSLDKLGELVCSL